MVVTTVKSELTWDGVVGKMLSQQSEKKIKNVLKDMTGAVDVEINDISSWDEEEEFKSYNED